MKPTVTNLLAGLVCALALPANAASAKIDSIYTSLDAKDCKTLEANQNEGGSYRGRCAGVAGYQLDLLEGDLRQTLNVTTPDNREFPLELWSTVSSGFSSLGSKAEWRVKRVGRKLMPVALIVRYNASEDPEKPEKTTSYLVVSKIRADEVCVTDVVKPIKGANRQARDLADAATGKACMGKGNPAEQTPPLVGGMSPADPQDTEVIKAAEFAATQMGQELDSVLEASQQVVAGMNYAMTIRLKDGATWKVTVYKDLQGNYSLSESAQQ